MFHPSAEARQLMWQVEARLAGRTPSNQRDRQRERFDFERALEDPDTEVRRAAAQGTERVPLLPDGAEPDESADEILACDVERAKQGWQALKGVMAQRRFHYGVDAATLAPSVLPLTFDLETRWCLQVRASHEHPDANVVLDAEVFPFR